MLCIAHHGMGSTPEKKVYLMLSQEIVKYLGVGCRDVPASESVDMSNNNFTIDIRRFYE
jgi:hypothetical protein